MSGTSAVEYCYCQEQGGDYEAGDRYPLELVEFYRGGGDAARDWSAALIELKHPELMYSEAIC
jgi:hypothetical protein